VLLKERLSKINQGLGEPADLDYLLELGNTIKTMSRCGLGQTSANPVLTTLKSFRATYNALVKKRDNGFQPAFDLRAAVTQAEQIAGRHSEHARA
jgi:[NiFe] hydrogenase diaphorase moiety large subunit